MAKIWCHLKNGWTTRAGDGCLIVAGQEWSNDAIENSSVRINPQCHKKFAILLLSTTIS
jgi:hypothetical protein